MPTRSPWHIRGDLHVHAQHTVCDRHRPGDPVAYGQFCGRRAIEEMRSWLRQRRYEYLALVNHATNPINPTAPTASSEQQLQEHRLAVEQTNAESASNAPRLLAGAEASLLGDGNVDVSQTTLCSLSLVIASRHGNSTAWGLDQTLERLQHLFRKQPIHVLGHPTRYVAPAPLSQYRQLLRLCTQFGIAFELNARNPFGDELVSEIVGSGVLISLGSDLHGDMLQQRNAPTDSVRSIPLIRALQQRGFPAARLVNTWPLAKLNAWLAKRRAMCNT